MKIQFKSVFKNDLLEKFAKKLEVPRKIKSLKACATHRQ